MSEITSSSIEEKFDNPSPKEFVNESCINADVLSMACLAI